MAEWPPQTRSNTSPERGGRPPSEVRRSGGVNWGRARSLRFRAPTRLASLADLPQSKSDVSDLDYLKSAQLGQAPVRGGGGYRLCGAACPQPTTLSCRPKPR